MGLNFAPSLVIFASFYFIYHQYILLAYHFFRCTIFAARNALLSIVPCSKVQVASDY